MKDKKAKNKAVSLGKKQIEAILPDMMAVLRKNEDIARDISKHIGGQRPGDACFHPRWRMVVGALEGLNKATIYEIFGILQDNGIVDFGEKDWKYNLGFHGGD